MKIPLLLGVTKMEYLFLALIIICVIIVIGVSAAQFFIISETEDEDD